jgi:hypothetical protein
MRRFLFLILALVAGCSTGAQTDLQYIGEARSLAAEWALVNEQAAQGKLSAAYVSAMHKALRQQVQTASGALTQPNSDYSREMQAIAALPDDAAPQQLRSHSDRLEQIEKSLESA